MPLRDRNVEEAKKEYKEDLIDQIGYHCCERCGDTGGRLEFSHIMSVDFCQKEGMADIAWDKNNLELLCRKHHRVVESWEAAKRYLWYKLRMEKRSFMCFLREWHRQNFIGL